MIHGEKDAKPPSKTIFHAFPIFILVFSSNSVPEQFRSLFFALLLVEILCPNNRKYSHIFFIYFFHLFSSNKFPFVIEG